MTSPYTDHSPYQEANEQHDHAVMLQLQLQGIAENLTVKLELFEDNLRQEREKFLKELCDVENWLEEVYGVLERDPRHDLVPFYTPEEVHAMLEEYSDDGFIDEECDAAAPREGASPEGVKSESVDGTHDITEFSLHRELTISGSSLGSDILNQFDGTELMETSVDVEMSDEEYQQQVMDRVMSGSSSSSSSNSPSHLERSAPLETSVDPFDDPVDPVGDEWAGLMEEETDFPTDTASVSSSSTLRGDGQGQTKSPDMKRVAVEFSEDEVNVDEVKPDNRGSERVEEKREGKSLAEELGELGVELEQDFTGEKEANEEDGEESEQESGGKSPLFSRQRVKD